MQKSQFLLFMLRRSYICCYIIWMTVPLIKDSSSKGNHLYVHLSIFTTKWLWFKQRFLWSLLNYQEQNWNELVLAVTKVNYFISSFYIVFVFILDTIHDKINLYLVTWFMKKFSALIRHCIVILIWHNLICRIRQIWKSNKHCTKD